LEIIAEGNHCVCLFDGV